MRFGQSFDEWQLTWIDHHRIAPVTSFTRALMDVGTSLTVLVVIGIVGLVVIVLTRAWRIGLTLVIAPFIAGETTRILKFHFERARPPIGESLVNVGGYAMPSSHAAVTSATVVGLLLVVSWSSARQRRLAATVLIAGLIVVAASMVYLGAHWATDVVAGWTIGIVAGFGVGAALRPHAGQSSTSPASLGRAQ